MYDLFFPYNSGKIGVVICDGESAKEANCNVPVVEGVVVSRTLSTRKLWIGNKNVTVLTILTWASVEIRSWGRMLRQVIKTHNMQGRIRRGLSYGIAVLEYTGDRYILVVKIANLLTLIEFFHTNNIINITTLHYNFTSLMWLRRNRV